MPKLSGIELRAKIHENEDLRLKSIPYLFFSTSAEQGHVVDAYQSQFKDSLLSQQIFPKLNKQ
jgi:CheY-like chemotaxis protein